MFAAFDGVACIADGFNCAREQAGSRGSAEPS